MFLVYNVLATMAVGCVECKVLCSVVVHNLRFFCFLYIYIYIYIYISFFFFLMAFVLWVGL